MDDINYEISQGSKKIPYDELKKEKEYFLNLPYIGILDKYISRQEEQKTYLVTKESMIKFEGRKYSVPTRYIGERLTAKKEDGYLYIYYTNKQIVCHPITSKMYNYTRETALDILKSDAMKNRTVEEIEEFVEKNLFSMDR